MACPQSISQIYSKDPTPVITCEIQSLKFLETMLSHILNIQLNILALIYGENYLQTVENGSSAGHGSSINLVVYRLWKIHF